MTAASKGASEKRKLTHYVTNTVLDSQFRGTSQFVLHFNEQFRRLDELTDLTERVPESIKMALLQNSVKDFPQLSIVETLDEYTSTTSEAGSCTHLTYTSYYDLLINACVRYDATNTSTPSKRRNVYAADGAYDHNGIAEPHRDSSLQTWIHPLGIFTRSIAEPHRDSSLQTWIHPLGIFTRSTKRNMANNHLHPYLGFRMITTESQPFCS